MEDKQIIELYLARREEAIAETQTKYGHYCQAIAERILLSFQDAEECVNDTYGKAWNSIPPTIPNCLRTFLGTITRRLAIDRYHYNTAVKRNDNMTLALEELGDCISGEIKEAENSGLGEILNEFLAKLPKKKRMLFVRRYWYLYSIKELSKMMGMSENNVKVTLLRLRIQLREHLAEEGIVV